MNLLKRDHLYAQKLFLVGFVLLWLLFLIGSVFLGRNDEYDALMYGAYQSFYSMSVLVMSAYPLHALITISPKRNELLTAPMITQFLPVSRGQLFWNNLKPWFVIYPGYLILTTLLYQPYFEHAARWADSISSMIIFGSMGILYLSLMTMTGIIHHLSQNNHMGMMLIKMLFKTLGVIGIGMLICMGLKIEFVNDLTWLFIIACLLLAYSLGEFIFSYRQIEEIYQ
ncbi:MAG TPA: hypothetical protein DCY20_08170 [Firmicutes bacterium]|nr:hypothetical protein [Bacillota bacterium]